MSASRRRLRICTRTGASSLIWRRWRGICIWARRIFSAAPPAAPLALWVKGSNFQFQVWRALLAIPPGGLTTYRTLAEGIGHPQAARAVGNAVAANSLAYLIPCHRVIRESGALGGYRWGLTRKSAIQGREAGGVG